MSRVAKAPVALPQSVEFQQSGNVVTIKGSKGALSMELNSEVELTQEDGSLQLAPRSGSRFSTAIAGTMRAILANMATGVSAGFEKKLELKGVGYRAQAQGKSLNLSLGFSHPVEVPIPEGLKVSVDRNVILKVEGVSRQRVGQFAADLRSIRPPEPYKGKGIRYANELVRRKVGKAGAAGG